MDKKLILNKLQEYYNFKKDIDFADFLGISGQVLSKWKTRNTYDIELIYTKCTEINPEWLITGNEPMIKPQKNSVFSQNITGDSNIQSGKSTNVANDNSVIQEFKKKVQRLENELKECKIKLDAKENQVSQLINTVTALSQPKQTK